MTDMQLLIKCANNPFTVCSNSLQFVDSQVRVICLGGRELRGALRGYDELVNLVLDDCEEFIRGEFDIVLQ